MDLILASQSTMRRRILNAARIDAQFMSPQIDEENITKSLIAVQALPRDIADTLAEHKALKISRKNLDSWVIGCDQILVFEGEVFGKPVSPEALKDTLSRFSGQTHSLVTANVIYKNGKPQWRHVSISQLSMRIITATEIDTYIEAHWPVVKHSAGGYHFERTPDLFSSVRGNWFDIMGLSIDPILSFLNQNQTGSPFQTPRLAAVLGHPVAQSKSPLMHGHWLKKNQVSGDYIAIDIPPMRFNTTVRMLFDVGFSGFNVTIPHKVQALAFADDMSSRAHRIGAANTLIKMDSGKISADNTDGYGFMTNLGSQSSTWLPGAGPSLVLGAGGAARAVLVALLDAGVPKIYLCNRTRARAEDLAADISYCIEVIDWEDKQDILPDVFTVVNATSLGMTGKPPLEFDLKNVNPDALVTDLIYAPLETQLLRDARARGCEVVSGIGMLLHQGVPGFDAWFGSWPAVDEELEALVLS
jgi:shikimate dehydrogenase